MACAKLNEAKSRTHQDDRSFTLHLLLQYLSQQDPRLLRLVATPRKIRVERRRRCLEQSQRERDARIDRGKRRPLDDFDAAHREEAVLDILVERASGFEESCRAVTGEVVNSTFLSLGPASMSLRRAKAGGRRRAKSRTLRVCLERISVRTG